MGRMYDLFGTTYVVFDDGKIYGRSSGTKFWYDLFTANNTAKVIQQCGVLIATNVQLK